MWICFVFPEKGRGWGSMDDMCSCPPHEGMILSLHTCLLPFSGTYATGDMELFCSCKRESDAKPGKLGKALVGE